MTTPHTLPLPVEAIPPGKESDFTLEVNECVRLDRLLLHPRWACSVHVRVLINRRFLVLDTPGWAHLGFTVDQTPQILEWIEGMTSALYQKEHRELADFLRGVTVRGAGELPKAILLVPGMRFNVYVRNVGREEVPGGIVGAFFGESLTSRDAVNEIARLLPEEKVALGCSTFYRPEGGGGG